MTSTHTSAELDLVTVGSFDALTRRLVTDPAWSTVQWRGRMQRGVFEVSIQGEKSRHQWTATLSGAQLRLR